MKKATKLTLAGVLALLCALYILLIRTFDVAPIGEGGTSVGLSHLNLAVFQAVGVHMLWYRITELLGYLALAVCGAFALLGLWQLVKRRSLLLVDREILALGVLYIVVLALYVFFEKAVVNYRPIIMPGETAPEASFPSSHTMLTITVMGSAMLVMKKYFNSPVREILQGVAAAILAVTVIGRLLSGVHWTTDILGGVLISMTLLTAFKAFADEWDA